MTKEEMSKFIEIDNPVTRSVRVDYHSGDFNVGFFIGNDNTLKKENKWRFVPNNSSVKYRETKSLEYSIVIEGDKVKSLLLV